MELKIEYVPITEIKPYKNNAKLHPKEQIEQIVRSITDYGMNDPIAVWKDNEIIEGHGRYLALKKMGYTEVPVIRLDGLTDAQRREYMLVHNKTTMNSGFDLDLLNLELNELPEFDVPFYDFEIADGMPDLDELDADADNDDKTVVRLVFPSYTVYSIHEQEVKDFAGHVGASVTVGK